MLVHIYSFLCSCYAAWLGHVRANRLLNLDRDFLQVAVGTRVAHHHLVLAGHHAHGVGGDSIAR